MRGTRVVGVMSTRAAVWLAWTLAGLSLALDAASVVLLVLLRSVHVPITVLDMVLIVPNSAFPVVGALIASKRPHNPIGWICLADGLLWALITLSWNYGIYGLARPGSVPFPVTIYALLSEWLWVPAIGLLGTYVILLFPDGRLPSKRWLPLAWISGAMIGVTSVAMFFDPVPLLGLGRVRNPFGLEGLPWLDTALVLGFLLLLVCILASTVNLVLRYRRSEGEVRQQIKWFAFAVSFTCLAFLTVLVAAMVTGEATPYWYKLLEYVWLLSLAGVPVSIGFAVLRYRLYDIDFIINRTLLYGSLSVALAALFAISEQLLQSLVFVITGTDEQSRVVTYASVVVIAIAFQPLRQRIEKVVNRIVKQRSDANNMAS